MKKLASVVLASAMAVVPFAAGLAATFTPGEYEASAQGFGGAVTVKGDRGRRTSDRCHRDRRG